MVKLIKNQPARSPPPVRKNARRVCSPGASVHLQHFTTTHVERKGQRYVMTIHKSVPSLWTPGSQCISPPSAWSLLNSSSWCQSPPACEAPTHRQTFEESSHIQTHWLTSSTNYYSNSTLQVLAYKWTILQEAGPLPKRTVSAKVQVISLGISLNETKKSILVESTFVPHVLHK